MTRGSPLRIARRVAALSWKETLQIARDPSTLLIALVFPAILLCIFGAGINLDTSVIPIDVVVDDASPAAGRLVETIARSPSFRATVAKGRPLAEERLRAGVVRGYVVIRNDFARSITPPPGLARSDPSEVGRSLLVVTDGAEPNTASFVDAYVRGAYGVWLREEAATRGSGGGPRIDLEVRTWFNPSSESRNFLLPGAITLIMTVVGALLTALVVAREWERGTMEALLAAGVTRFELLASKIAPYFVLGCAAFGVCVAVTVFGFHVPLRGSVAALATVGATFLGSALGLGLLLSTALRSQYNAAQAALNAAFLPAMMLSGFVFEIASMPAPIQWFTRIVPARYFVTAMQTIFQAGDVVPVLARALASMCVAASLFLGATYLLTRRSLE